MAFDLALFDLVSPYVLLGDSFGQWHAALSVIYVDEYTVAVDEAGVVIRGVARFSGEVQPFIDPSSMTFGVNAENTEGHPANDPGRRDPWIDIRDAHIDFELTAPRVASQKVATAIAAIGGAASFAAAAAVFNAYDTIPGDAPPSDYPSTQFVLDLLLTTIVLRPPFLLPAKLEPNGLLVEDTTKSEVKFNLPKIKARLAQGSSNTDALTVQLLSVGASGLDDPGDLGVAELVSMEPPYAFVGSSKVVGFGFRSATLDLSTGSTPPDVLSQFGYDETWTGLYLPEIRLFIAPHGADDFAVDGSATNLLIGFGASAGVTGDFGLDVIDQGSGTLRLGARFYDPSGQSYAITRINDTTARVALPDRSRLVVDVDGGRSPYAVTAAFDGGAPQTGRVFEVDLSASGSQTIAISATDARPAVPATPLTITANRRPATAPALPGTATTPASPPAQVQTTGVTRGGSPVTTPRLRLVSGSETPTSVSVALDVTPPQAAHWTIGGIDRGTSLSVAVDLPPGATVAVQAEVAGSPGGVSSFTAYYRFDHPQPAADSATRAYAQIDDSATSTRSTNTVPAVDAGLTTPWPLGDDAGSALQPLLAALPPNTPIEIKGYASFETGGATALTYNTALARRRAIGLEAIIQAHSGGKNFTLAAAADMSRWNPTDQGDPVRNLFWKAVASWPPQATPGTITQGTVSRSTAQPIVPVPVPDHPTAATPPPPPSWFKSIGAKVRIVRNQFVACEVYGKFDIQTPAENQLRQGGVSDSNMPALRRLGNNPADGIIDVRLVVQIDDATDTVTVSGYFGADPADRDGLMMSGSLPNEALTAPSLGRNYLGLAIAFMPLLSAASSAVAGDGALAEIGVTAAVLALPFTLGSLGTATSGAIDITVERVIWYGGELTVQVRPEGAQGVVLLDLETAISLKVAPGGQNLITISRTSPLTLRYKAIGLMIGNPPGQPKFQFRPLFDASKGYSIDVSKPGAIQVAEPLGQILKILGARMARNNPLLFEVDLGFAIDLGVVSIDRARVRMPLDPVGPPELTAFGAGVNIPGVLRGHGYLELSAVEIKGQLDLTLVPLQIRIAAGVGVAHIPPEKGGPATGVIVTLSVEFPVAIPLANSGLGIYGFLGLFAMNYARNEDEIPADHMAPALAWLKATGGDPTNLAFWKPKVNTWAFGVGAILGTMGSSVIFNLKGVILLELPGPRLLLMMKANLLAVMPAVQGTAEGTFLAVIDLDFGRGTLTIGLTIDFNVDPLLRLKIPVEAFFNFNNSGDWHLYLGQYLNQIQARVLQIFDASGYLMLSGSGLSGIADLPAVTGFAIATGLHVSFRWGGGPLYAELAAGFDAIVGFSPFRMAGILTVRGTLHLFIIDISAWADLHVDIGTKADGNKIAKIWGDICGRVDFFFFSVEGCISFSLGDDSVPIADPPDLVKLLKLVSRSPALVMGTGVDKPIDAGIGDGVASDTQPTDDKMPIVAIDAIPALLMAQPPLEVAGLKFLGQDIGNTSNAPAGGWVQRGDVFFKYTLKSVELIGPRTAGQTPATWWAPKAGKVPLDAQLALLSWVPEATPKAVGSSKYLDEMVHDQWGTVCDPAAPPAPVLFTFLQSLFGPSPIGWNLEGQACPDPSSTVRSTPADTQMQVIERWRSGDPFLDKLRGIVPAQVEGGFVACPTPPGLQPGSNLPGLLPRLTMPDRVPSLVDRVPSLVTAQVPVQNPIAAIRGSQSLEPIQSGVSLRLTDAIQQIRQGQPIARADLLQMTLPTTVGTSSSGTIAGTSTPKCLARVLASPLFDDGAIVSFGNLARARLVKQGWAAQGFRPGPLDNAVVFKTGEFEYVRFYLWVPRRLLDQTIVVTGSNANDQFFNPHTVTPADAIPPASFPSSWTAASSPWHHDVALVSQLLPTTQEQYVGVWVELKGDSAADRVQIGALPNSRKLRQVVTLRPFYVAAIEVLRRAETSRFDYDSHQQQKKQGVLAKALGLDSADNALLMAGQVYQVKVTWDAMRERRPQGQPPTDQKTVTDRAQTFWFKTDTQPPQRLDPWMLVALPGEAEPHYFAAEPVKLVFATNNLARLYAAYGKKLQVRLKPASFRPVPSTPTVPHPFPLNEATLQPVKAAILSPWEEAVQNLVTGGCVPVKEDRIRHTMTTIDIPLDLHSDYLIDIEMLDQAAAEGTVGQRVWRGTFSTGGFRTLEEFATSFQIARVQHRGVHSDDIGKLVAIGVTFASRNPQGSELDSALIAAGLDPQPVPSFPRAIVFWEASGPTPQPVAVLIDGSEPLWRSRPIPTVVADPGSAQGKHYEMASTPWLKLVQSGGAPIVDHIIPAPGNQRALVTLKPGARGQPLRLALRRIAQPAPYLDGTGAIDQDFALLDLSLLHAPWEEVD